MPNLHSLNRYLTAQAPVWQQARAELQAGQKRTHWMWFIFPQIRGLGRSSMAVRYAIGSLEEARTYLAHPLLGARLRELTEIVSATRDRTAAEIVGYPDDLKFHSSMTLFGEAASGEQVFARALGRYFGGVKDQATLDRLR